MPHRSKLAHTFDSTSPLACFGEPAEQARPPKQHRNPLVLALEWQRALDDRDCASRADLARRLGVSRARVTQVLGLLDLAPAVVRSVVALGDPLPGPSISERMLRPLLKLPPEEQRRALQAARSQQVV